MILSLKQSDRLRTAGWMSLLAAAFLLPFELKYPLFRAGPLGITSTEIGIYLTIGIWGALWLIGGRRTWTPVHTAVAIWGATVVLSALLTGNHPNDSLKFALRSLAGCALFFAASDLARDFSSLRQVMVALVAGSCISAAAALAEIRLPGAAAFLMSFKTQPSLSGSYLRASGTFQYANIASMFWEATLPLALIFPLARRLERGAGLWTWLGAASSIMLIEAILLGSSRAGIIIAALLLLILLLMSFRPALTPLRAPAGVGLFSLLGLVLVHAATDDLFRLRFTTRDESSWYSAEFREFPVELTLEAGLVRRVPLTIGNTGRIAWRAKGRQSVAVGYHWLDPAAQNILIWNGARSEIPSDVEPGATVQMRPWVIAPALPGRYTLQWDMLQENVAWFSAFGSRTAEIRVLVLPSNSTIKARIPPNPVSLPLPSPPTRFELWRTALRMWRANPVFGVGPDNFRHLYGAYLGPKKFDDRIHTNSLYLEMLVNVGLAGAIALIAIPVTTAISLRRSWKEAGRSGDRLLPAGIVFALAAFYVHGFVDYFLLFTPTYGLFWMLTGLAAGARCKEKSK